MSNRPSFDAWTKASTTRSRLSPRAALAGAARVEVPGAELVPVALDEERAAAGAVGRLPADVVGVAGVDVLEADVERLLPRPRQRRRRRRRQVVHLEVGVERGEV